jgi:hypothetical protein
MSKPSLKSVIGFASVIPLAGALALASVNQPTIKPRSVNESVSRPMAETYMPITYQEERVLYIPDVVITSYATIKLYESKELVWTCKEWRKEKMILGMVKECGYE